MLDLKMRLNSVRISMWYVCDVLTPLVWIFRETYLFVVWS